MRVVGAGGNQRRQGEAVEAEGAKQGTNGAGRVAMTMITAEGGSLGSLVLGPLGLQLYSRRRGGAQEEEEEEIEFLVRAEVRAAPFHLQRVDSVSLTAISIHSSSYQRGNCV